LGAWIFDFSRSESCGKIQRLRVPEGARSEQRSSTGYRDGEECDTKANPRGYASVLKNLIGSRKGTDRSQFRFVERRRKTGKLEMILSLFGELEIDHGEFDPGSERTLAARLKHAS
jgi:hypothetical protein